MYVVDYNSDEPIMLIDDQIGVTVEEGVSVGIDGHAFARELLELDGYGKKRIQVWINSPGGSVIEGQAIYNAINASKTKVDTRCIGMAASIAAVIFQAGRKREMNDYGFLMFHNPYDPSDENSKDPMLEVMRKGIVTMIESKSGMSPQAVETMMNVETFLTADEAFSKGLCDVIINSEDLNVKRKVSTPVEAKQYAKYILNKILTPVNMPFPKVTNRLKLNADASEDSVVLAIDEIQNKLDAATVLNKKSKEEMDKMKNDMDEAEDKFNKMKVEFDNAKKELSDAKDLALTEKCQNMVKGYAEVGRIKNEAKNIARYVALAKADFEGTEEMIKDIPLNKETASLISDKAVDKAPVGTSMAAEMARIRNQAKKK